MKINAIPYPIYKRRNYYPHSRFSIEYLENKSGIYGFNVQLEYYGKNEVIQKRKYNITLNTLSLTDN